LRLKRAISPESHAWHGQIGDHAGTILAKQHHSFSSVARATAMHQGETAMAAKKFARHRE
jgi:hypothetical protein